MCTHRFFLSLFEKKGKKDEKFKRKKERNGGRLTLDYSNYRFPDYPVIVSSCITEPI